MTDLTSRGTAPLRALVRARISKDPGQNMSGVGRQVRDGLAAVAADPMRELAADVPGSLIQAGLPRRVRDAHGKLVRRPPRDLAALGDLVTDSPEGPRWPAGVLVDNDRGAIGEDGERPALPEYDRMTGLLADGTAQAVWSASLDRIWREPSEYYDMQKLLRKHRRPEVMIDTSEHGRHDLSDPNADFIVGVLTGTARLEVMKTRQRINAQSDDYARQARAHGKAPFALRTMHAQPDGGMHEPQASESGTCPACQGRKTGEWRTYVHVRDEARALADAARRALGGAPDEPWDELAARVLAGDPTLRPEPPYAVCGVLDDVWKVTTRTGLPWRTAGLTSLRDVLLNPAYTGHRARNKGWTGTGHRDLDATELSAEQGWDALWPQSVHDALRKTLTSEKITVSVTRADGTVTTAQRRRNPNTWAGKAEPRHLLTGLIECACGAPMFVQHNRSRPRYTCQVIMRGNAGGDGRGGEHAVRAKEDVETEAELTILRWMADGGLYDQARRAAGSGETAELEAELAGKIRERDRKADSDAAYDIPMDERKRRAAPVNAEIAGLRERLAAATVHDRLSWVTERGPGFARAWQEWDLVTRRNIAAALTDRVVVHPAARRGGSAPDPRFIQVFPAGWAREAPGAQPPPVPDRDALSSRGRVRAYLAALPAGQLATAEDIADGCGFPVHTARVALGKLLAAGEAEREWMRPDGAPAADGSGRGLTCYGWRAAA